MLIIVFVFLVLPGLSGQLAVLLTSVGDTNHWPCPWLATNYITVLTSPPPTPPTPQPPPLPQGLSFLLLLIFSNPFFSFLGYLWCNEVGVLVNSAALNFGVPVSCWFLVFLFYESTTSFYVCVFSTHRILVLAFTGYGRVKKIKLIF